jgi:hypothetical protein
VARRHTPTRSWNPGLESQISRSWNPSIESQILRSWNPGLESQISRSWNPGPESQMQQHPTRADCVRPSQLPTSIQKSKRNGYQKGYEPHQIPILDCDRNLPVLAFLREIWLNQCCVGYSKISYIYPLVINPGIHPLTQGGWKKNQKPVFIIRTLVLKPFFFLNPPF